MPAQKKIETVQKIKDRLAKTKSLVLTDHTGTTHLQLEKLRKSVKKLGGDFLIIKNTLLKRALEATDFQDKIDEKLLQGPTSLLLSLDDEIAPIRELVKTSRELNLLKIKQGALNDRALTSEEVIRLANLPAKEVLISQLLGMLKSPQVRLVYALKGNLIKLALVLKAVSEKKEKN